MKDLKATTFSIDEARAELAKRWEDIELRRAIETDLGNKFVPELRDYPRAVIGRQLVSPDNALTLFIMLSNYVRAKPFAWEFHGDRFSHSNIEKAGLGRLRVTLSSGIRGLVEAVSFTAENQKPIGKVVTRTGESLTGFHHRLLELSGLGLECRDMTDWYQANGKPTEYYYPFLMHFVAHGVLFEAFDVENDYQEVFTQDVIIPIFLSIKKEYGLSPIVVRLYPANQTPDEDFFWWSYPRTVNDYLDKYAKENKFPIRILE